MADVLGGQLFEQRSFAGIVQAEQKQAHLLVLRLFQSPQDGQQALQGEKKKKKKVHPFIVTGGLLLTAEQIMFDLKSSVALLLLLPLLWCALLWGNLPQGEIRNVQCEWMVSKKRVQDGFDSELFTSHAAKNKTLSLHPVTNHMYKFRI